MSTLDSAGPIVNDKSHLQKEGNSYYTADEESSDLTNNAHKKDSDYTEPITHIKNKSFCERLCGPFCCQGKTKLTHDELVAFYKLKEDASIMIPRDSEEYDHILRKLWGLLSTETLDKIEDKRWQNYGFQNPNPRSDFRGAGLLSLNQLVYFSSTYPLLVASMCEPSYQFLYAVSSINVTFFLVKFYHLSDDISLPRDKKEIATRKGLKSFCVMLDEDPEILNRIHGMLLTDLFNLWVDFQKNNSGVTLMDFSIVLKTLKKKFRKATKKSCTNFEELALRYASIKFKKPKK